MRRITGLVAVAFSAAFLLFISGKEGHSAILLLRNYNNPELPAMRLLNERHLDGIIDGIISYNIFLHENNSDRLFCLPADSVITVQQAEEIMLGYRRDSRSQMTFRFLFC